ncbi:PAS domain S-box protein [Dactylosporangium sp. NBC_01737]|uniref:PAS domain-containing protein n=1 Tax=Dactylosporangium sp. NBC_01737 TaxID=2975959 RepID=UPI002E15F7D8|nr:PAS domain S-box protein [Dactylosporangium sp. NBC_01737]
MSRRQILITAVYGALMTALGSVVFIAPELDSVAWAGIGLLGAAAIVVGIRLVRPRRPGPWWALAAALVAMMAGDYLYGLMADASADPPPLANLCYLAMFPFVATALIGLTRASSALDSRAGLLDLLAVSSAALLAAWVFIVSPRLGTGGVTGTEWSIQAAYTLGDVVVLVVTVRLVRAAPRNPSAVLLAVGALGMLTGDVAYGIAQSRDGLAPGGPADLAYVVLYATWGAAALLPSMARLTDSPVAPPHGDAPVRGLGIVLLLAAVAVAPVVLVGQALTGPVHDGPVIAVAFGISLALLVTRLNDAVRRHAEGLRRERTLRHAGTVLVSVTDAGAVAVAVRTAVRELLPADTPHIIVVDSSLTDLLPLNELSAPRIVPVHLTPPLWQERLGEFGCVLVCPLDAAVLYIAADGRDLRTVQDAVTVLAGQAALALARIALTEAASRRDSDDYLRAVAEHTNDVVLVLDDDERIRYTSPSVTELLGIWPTPFATLREIVAPDDRQQVDATLGVALTGGRDGTRDTWSLRRPDGTRVLVEVRFRDLRGDRLVRGMVITMRDVTEQRRHELELLRRHWEDTPGAANRDNSARKYH